MDLGEPDGVDIAQLLASSSKTPALRTWLDERTDAPWTSSVLLEIEAFRALARYAPTAASRLHLVLDLMSLVDIDAGIRILAHSVRPATVHSLDAIHLATALRVRPAAFVTYDKRLAEAARDAGLSVVMPGA